MGRRSRVEDGRVGMKRDGKHFCLRDRVEVEECKGEGVFVCFPSGLRVANVDDGIWGFDVDRLMTHGAIDVNPLPQSNNPEISGSPDLYIGLRFRGEQPSRCQPTTSTTT